MGSGFGFMIMAILCPLCQCLALLLRIWGLQRVLSSVRRGRVEDDLGACAVSDESCSRPRSRFSWAASQPLNPINLKP